MVLAARPDGGALPSCPVTVTNRGNGVHELSYTIHTVRSTPRFFRVLYGCGKLTVFHCYIWLHQSERTAQLIERRFAAGWCIPAGSRRGGRHFRQHQSARAVLCG